MERESPLVGSAEDLGSPKSFWSLQSQKNSSEFAMSPRRPVPCEQGAADLRRKRQPAAHAVPCISETAEKSVKYTVFVEVTPWMEPKGAKSEPKGAKREPKGAKMETKSIKNPSKWFPKPTRAPRSILDCQNGTKTDPKWSQKASKIYAKSFKNQCKTAPSKGGSA